MRILKSNPIIGLANSYLIDSPQPSNISYMWNMGSLLGITLVIQIITGVLLAMHYVPTSELAFISVEMIIREVTNGWVLRYTHANGASIFFIFVYLHVARGIYYGSYRAPRTTVWSLGVVILILIIAIAFLGYCLVYGQISIWGSTVITNLLSAIPWIGNDFVILVWGGFSVNSATLNRFFALHFLLPFVLAALAAMHILTLHQHGSSNPLGINGNVDRVGIAPYFLFKDLVTIIFALLLFSVLVFYLPNSLGHADNYIIANPISTPASIVPEWYLLPFYAILRSIDSKLGGVVAIFSALLILLVLPVVDLAKVRSNTFRPLIRLFFWAFVMNFLLLIWLGSCHVEAPFTIVGQFATLFYFSYFLVILPILGLLENTLTTAITRS